MPMAKIVARTAPRVVQCLIDMTCSRTEFVASLPAPIKCRLSLKGSLLASEALGEGFQLFADAGELWGEMLRSFGGADFFVAVLNFKLVGIGRVRRRGVMRRELVPAFEKFGELTELIVGEAAVGVAEHSPANADLAGGEDMDVVFGAEEAAGARVVNGAEGFVLARCVRRGLSRPSTGVVVLAGDRQDQ